MTAVKIDVKMPIDSVTANPRIGPEPSQNMITAAANDAQLLPPLPLLERRFEEAELQTRFYSPAVHHAAATMAAALPKP